MVCFVLSGINGYRYNPCHTYFVDTTARYFSGLLGVHAAAIQIGDGDEIHETPVHRDVGGTGCPDVIGGLDAQVPQQIGISGGPHACD